MWVCPWSGGLGSCFSPCVKDLRPSITVRVDLLLIGILRYRISSNLSDTSNYPGHSFGQFSLF